MLLEVIFVNGVKLCYTLKDNIDSYVWTKLVRQVNSTDLKVRNHNEHRGFNTYDEILVKIERLNFLCDKFKLPAFILNDIWDIYLNKLHIYFTDSINVKQPSLILTNEWHEVNVLIHWLEHALDNYLNNKQQYIINADFNHTPEIYARSHKIVHKENFSPYLDFGTLHNHYVHIGRHFLELCNANDFECPKSHFVPQYILNATFGMCFSEPQDHKVVDLKHKKYYLDRGGFNFWNIPFFSESLVNGYHQIGKLLGDYDTYQKRSDLRDSISYSKINYWKIKL